MGCPNMSKKGTYHREAICINCGSKFIANSYRARYCPACNPHLKENRFKTHRDKPLQRKPKICEWCNKSFIPRSPNVRFCDDCKKELRRLHFLRKPILKCKCCGGYYIPTGNNQKRCEFCGFKQMSAGNHRTIAFENFPHICNRCGKSVTLTTSHVHHKDRNPKNNTLDNLEILCTSCHRHEHMVRDPQTGKIITNR